MRVNRAWGKKACHESGLDEKDDGAPITGFMAGSMRFWILY